MCLSDGIRGRVLTEITAFNFRSGNTWVHGLDVRVKLAALVLLSLSSVHIPPLRLTVMIIALLCLIKYLDLSLISIFRELRFFLILLLIIFATRMLSASGVPAYSIGPVAISLDGILQGGVVCLRLILVVLLGLILVASTRYSEIKRAVEWALTPFPFIPKRRVATMIGLLLRFIPVIFNEAREIKDAQRARAIEARKNPVYRIVKLTVPLVRRTFLRAEKLALAMEARCYQEMRTDPQFNFSKKDGLILAMLIGFLVFGLGF